MKRRLRCTFLVVLALLLAGGCDTAEQQNNFEDEAFSTPSGFTRTDENGQILSEDKDDWRTAPVYSTSVLIDPAFPNPTAASDFVNVPVSVREFNSIEHRGDHPQGRRLAGAVRPQQPEHSPGATFEADVIQRPDPVAHQRAAAELFPHLAGDLEVLPEVFHSDHTILPRAGGGSLQSSPSANPATMPK